MLDVNVLQQNIQSALENTIPVAIETCIKQKIPRRTKQSYAEAEEFANTWKELVCENLATLLANAIDYYVKNISITGTVITTGSPTTQTAQITSMPMPVLNGAIPNTLGIK